MTREVFRAIGRVDQELTPKLRELTQQLKHRGQTVVVEIHAPEQLTALMEEISRESS